MSEKIYDKKIAPLLLEVAKICKENNMSVVAQVEYAPQSFGTTQHLSEDRDIAMLMTLTAALAKGNVDLFFMQLMKDAKEKDIDTSRSMVCSMLKAIAD